MYSVITENIFRKFSSLSYKEHEYCVFTLNYNLF